MIIVDPGPKPLKANKIVTKSRRVIFGHFKKFSQFKP